MKNQKVLTAMVLAILFSAQANAQKTKLSKNEVPIKITNYINQNFKDHKIKKVIKEINNNIAEYEIKLNKKVELEFDESFKIKEIDSKFGVSTLHLPTPIVEYVQAHYPDFIIIEWKLNEHGQEVELSNGSEIQFNPNGNFIK